MHLQIERIHGTFIFSGSWLKQCNVAHLIRIIESYAEERAGLSFMTAEFCLDPATVTGSSLVVICTVFHSQ